MRRVIRPKYERPETIQVAKTEFFESALARLQDTAGAFFSLLEGMSDFSARTGVFWASIRLMAPEIDAIAAILGEEPWEFPGKHLDVEVPSLTWEMFRHSLVHGGFMRHVQYQAKKVSWGMSTAGQGHITESGHVGIDVQYLYNKLIAYL